VVPRWLTITLCRLRQLIDPSNPDMSSEVELTKRGASIHPDLSESDATPPVDAGLGVVGVIALALLSPLLLVLALLLALVWLLLLPFRSCMHRHGSAAGTKPDVLTSALSGGGSDGEWFRSDRNGTWLFYRRWMPRDEPRGILFVAHGFGEHISREGYYALARKVNEAGYALMALDHQGHGRSTGDRAYFENIDDVVADYIQFIHMPVEKLGPEIPRFIFGHSSQWPESQSRVRASVMRRCLTDCDISVRLFVQWAV
jgi:hypothetical protein